MGEAPYPFQALIDAVQAHVNAHGGTYRIAEGSATFPCGHVLPCAVAIDASRLTPERLVEKVGEAFENEGCKPCPECRRLEQELTDADRV